MNERIRELAEQAGYDIKPFYKGEDNYQIPHYKDETLEKFAELIIRECATIADEYDLPKMSGPGMIIANRIRDQFGVDESE